MDNMATAPYLPTGLLKEADPMQKILIRSSTANDYRTITATGANCSLTSNGDVYIDFFIEKPAYKDSEIEIDGSGRIQKSVETNSPTIIREFQTGLLIRPEIALLIAELINQGLSIRDEHLSGGNNG